VSSVREQTIPTEQPPTFVDRECRIVSAVDLYGRILGFLDRSRYSCHQAAISIVLTRLKGPRSKSTTSQETWQHRDSNLDLWICSQKPGPLDHRRDPHNAEIPHVPRKRVKLSLCQTKLALRHELVYGNGCIDPCFLDRSTSWRWVVTVPPPLYSRENSPPRIHWKGGWLGQRLREVPPAVNISSRYTATDFIIVDNVGLREWKSSYTQTKITIPVYRRFFVNRQNLSAIGHSFSYFLSFSCALRIRPEACYDFTTTYDFFFWHSFLTTVLWVVLVSTFRE
jgi:hypothetical protein